MNRWEYLTFSVDHDEKVWRVNGEFIAAGDRDGFQGFLNEKGTEGWELVAATAQEESGRQFVLKRPQSGDAE